jgi:hypothetical protein
MIYDPGGSLFKNFLASRGPESLSFFKSQKITANYAAGPSISEKEPLRLQTLKRARQELQLSTQTLPRLRALQTTLPTLRPLVGRYTMGTEALVQMRRTQGQLAVWSKHNSKAIASTFVYKPDEAWNSARAAVVHHTGSHYHHRGGCNLYQKGFRLKGVVSRHSRQAAQRNQAGLRTFGRTSGTSFKEKGSGGGAAPKSLRRGFAKKQGKKKSV